MVEAPNKHAKWTDTEESVVEIFGTDEGERLCLRVRVQLRRKIPRTSLSPSVMSLMDTGLLKDVSPPGDKWPDEPPLVMAEWAWRHLQNNWHLVEVEAIPPLSRPAS
jgi:hypothetical protein